MSHHRSRYSWVNGWFRCTDNRTIYTLDRGWVDYRWQCWVKLLHDWKDSSKRSELLGFYLYFCHVIQRFCYTSFAALRQVRNRTWQSPVQLFVAQVLIKKILTHSAAEIRIYCPCLMAWEENSRICLHMQLIAILSRIGVRFVWQRTPMDDCTDAYPWGQLYVYWWTGITGIRSERNKEYGDSYLGHYGCDSFGPSSRQVSLWLQEV